jgi:MFS family permease
MDLFYPYGGALVAPFTAMYVASVLCRLQLKNGKRPGWMVGLISLIVGIVVAWLCSFQLDAFRPWRWNTVGGKVELQWLMGAVAFLSLLTSVVPAAFVVDRFQKKYDKAHPVVNESWQPTPGFPLACFRLPSTRRGCTLRSPL